VSPDSSNWANARILTEASSMAFGDGWHICYCESHPPPPPTSTTAGSAQPPPPRPPPRPLEPPWAPCPSPPPPTPPSPSVLVPGRAFDGPLKNCTVYSDLNSNGAPLRALKTRSCIVADFLSICALLIRTRLTLPSLPPSPFS
jgi:hypothetical protein